MDDLVANFVAITGASEQVARQLLEIANNDIEQAAVLFYDTDMAETLARQTQTSTSTTARPSATTASSRSTSRPSRQATASRARSVGHEDPEGVIHIDDSDGDDHDDDDFDDADDGIEEIEDDDDDDDNFHDAGDDTQMADAAEVARTAQEEEDEAMAKRLQEEMYAEQPGGGGRSGGESGGLGFGDGDPDDIRAPLGRTTETLVDPIYGGGGGFGYGESVFDRMRRQRSRVPNPFNQVWDDDLGAVGGSARLSPELPPYAGGGVAGEGVAAELGSSSTRALRGGAASSRQARLADLFRPPYDLMEHMSWEEARAVGKEDKRWILANIQDMSDFACQALNRDIWKDEAIKQLVRENFVFLQYSKEDMGAESYIQYYMPGGQHENPDNFPHVGIVDPRTGEQVKVWSGRPFPTALEFHAQLAEFLDRYSLDATKKNPVQRTKPPKVAKDVGRMTEDEMLEMALKNSLETAGGSGSGSSSASTTGAAASGSRPNIHDPDQLTGTPAPDDTEGEGKGKEKAEEEEEEAGAFAGIASNNPHEEPAAGPTVTRIQFRHATGRVIRRFAVDDRVVRIYEWLKSSPLEGKDGLEFELKVVPQGHDLLEDLDKTIEEAGLKQATVMIEYIE